MFVIVPEGQIFRANFSQGVGASRCLVAGVLAALWKWHRRLCHLSFDLLSRLSWLGLVRGLPKLKYQKYLVCAPCRHGKMVTTSHPPLTSVMIERPCELFHMDLVGPARVCSTGGKWYVLVIVDDYSRYAWVFFLADKGEMFGFVRDLILRSSDGILLGYGSHSRSFCVLNLDTNLVMKTCEVTFDETTMHFVCL
jgi:hypothetical protein